MSIELVVVIPKPCAPVTEFFEFVSGKRVISVGGGPVDRVFGVQCDDRQDVRRTLNQVRLLWPNAKTIPPDHNPEKSMAKWTPLHLEIVLHAHSSAGPYPSAHSDAGHEAIQVLLADQLIEATRETPNSYRTTPRGKAFVAMLVNTPLPSASFVDPRDDSVIAT